ncbi:MAG TPA: hypothetical protein VJP83_11285 [Terriglobales bacterium]|nr:hypothetical protein [Terriglobales bacterium]
MVARRIAALLLIVPLLLVNAWAKTNDQSSQPSGHLTKEQRLEIIRGLSAELCFARVVFPIGKKGLVLKDGKVVSPTPDDMRQLLAEWGPAVKPGDRAQITNVAIKGDSIRFEINGGPIKKQKWYQRIEVGGMGGMTPISPNSNPNTNPRGSYVDLAFNGHIPSLTPQQVKDMLGPVLDFSAHSAAEAYMATLPPKVRDAIKEHKVLVGMNREMVSYAKGRAPQKTRERDGNVAYEEWIYGAPPQEVEFIRFVGDEVVRVETMKVDGTKVVDTQKQVDLKQQPTVAQQQPQAEPGVRPPGAPTLRRPGEDQRPGQGPLPKGGAGDDNPQ